MLSDVFENPIKLLLLPSILVVWIPLAYIVGLGCSFIMFGTIKRIYEIIVNQRRRMWHGKRDVFRAKRQW